MSALGIIPARYASSRFPGKPLVDIKGKSMLQRVFEQAGAARGLSEVIIATDDERIASHARSIGAPVVMTSAAHPSGTDRCYEAYALWGKNHDYVINIQGDEPFLDPAQIDALAEKCDGEAEILTQMIACNDHEQLFNRGEVKIVLNTRSEALYFSRSVIPFQKNTDEKEWHLRHRYFRHVGMYAYRADILRKITLLPPSPLEQAESLEQLRWLENGYRITCIETTYDGQCIDTPEDLERAIKSMSAS